MSFLSEVKEKFTGEEPKTKITKTKERIKGSGLIREVLALDEVKNPEEDLTREQAVKEAQAKREAEAAEAAKAELAASVDEALAEKEAEEALADSVTQETEVKAEAPEAAEPTEPEATEATEPVASTKTAKSEEVAEPAEDESKEATEAAEPARPETKETEPVESEAPEATEPEPAPAVSEPESVPKTEVVSEPEPPRKRKLPEMPDFLVEARMRSLSFYNKLGEMAHEADSTGSMPGELEEYTLETLEKQPGLINQIIRDHLCEYLKKNPDTTEQIVAGNIRGYLEKNPDQLDEVAEVVKDVADANIEIGLKYVNKVDKTEFDNWIDACASIEDKTRYGIDPDDVFQKKYYWKKHPDFELSEDAVRGYVDKFNGHKDILIKKLQLEQQAKRSKKTDKGSKSNKPKAKAQNKAK